MSVDFHPVKMDIARDCSGEIRLWIVDNNACICVSKVSVYAGKKILNCFFLPSNVGPTQVGNAFMYCLPVEISFNHAYSIPVIHNSWLLVLMSYLVLNLYLHSSCFFSFGCLVVPVECKTEILFTWSIFSVHVTFLFLRLF